MYTDGLVERTRGRSRKGLRRLQELVEGEPWHPEALCDHIVEAMLRDVARPDDVAGLAMQPLRSPVVGR